MKFFFWVIACFVILVSAYFIWASVDKDYDSFSSAGQFAGEVISAGEESSGGNLIGMQPYLVPSDYCNEQHFKKALQPYFDHAKASGFIRPKSIVIFPENTGTWLVAHNEKNSVYYADSLMQAISFIVNSNIFKFIAQVPFTKREDKIKQSLFLMKAKSMARVYESVFSSLAKEYNVTIVAGSIILPDPSVNNDGRLKTEKGLLYNTTFIFGPTGKIIAQPVRKAAPGAEEIKFVSPSKINSNLLIATAAGSIRLLFSEDSLQKQIFKPGSFDGNTIVMASKGETTSLWKSPGEKREKRTMLTSIKGGSLMYISYSGKLWEQHYPGRIITQQGDSLKVFEPIKNKGAIVNLWLK